MQRIQLSRQRLREQIQEMPARLSERERTILELRFGLTDEQSYSLQEVGQRLGVTGERIRQIEARALHKLNYPARPRRSRQKSKSPVEYREKPGFPGGEKPGF